MTFRLLDALHFGQNGFVHYPSMRTNHWVARGVLALGIVACDRDAGSDDENGGKTSNEATDTEGAEPIDSGSTTVSYATDVRRIFADRCTTCHFTGSRVIDIANPFAAETGLVGSVNTWAEGYPEGNTPALNVTPGAPNDSFLLDKVSGEPIDTATAGQPMPWAVPRLTSDELGTLRQWIEDGANNDDFYAEEIRPIFGDETTLGRNAGKCTWCHYDGSPVPPNLSDPFDPQTGIVNVPSILRPDMMRVAPGSPDESFVVIKVEDTELSPQYGAPMPRHYTPLTDDEVDVLRSWIAAGAPNN